MQYLSPGAIRHRLATGRWHAVHRAVFVAPNGPVDAVQRRWIAALAIGDHAVLAGVTAAEVWGLRGFSGSDVHLLLPADRRADRAPGEVVVHRSCVLDGQDIVSAARPPRTRTARSLVDAAQWARTDAEAREIIAAGFQQRLVSGAGMARALERLPKARRRRLIAETVADAAGGAHSLAALDLLGLCRRHHLPEPTRQTVRRDATGRRRYLDAYFEEWHLHVEVDGAQHLDPRQAWADMKRQNDLWIAGDRVLRFPAWALRSDPAAVIAQIHAALTAAGWPG